jgi:hypothetical protein
MKQASRWECSVLVLIFASSGHLLHLLRLRITFKVFEKIMQSIDPS